MMGDMPYAHVVLGTIDVEEMPPIMYHQASPPWILVNSSMPWICSSVEKTKKYQLLSAMNIIKTERRDKMNDDWMNSIMICYIKWDLFASIEDEKILKRFQSLKNHKINLPCEGLRCVLYICISSFEYIILSCFFTKKYYFNFVLFQSRIS